MVFTRRHVGVGTLVSAWAQCVVLMATALGSYGQTPSLSALHTTEHITLDGKLDETVWREAPAITLTQQAPRPGQPNPYKTEVRVLASSDALYFGVVCHDPKPKAIAVH